jgi:hypothetical protein
MRELAIRKSAFTNAVQNGKALGQPQEKPISIKRLFHGLLREVPAPRQRDVVDLDQDLGIRRVSPRSQSAERERQVSNGIGNTRPTRKWRVLTIRELLGLTRATVRESREHRTWPPDVVLKFMAAEVVTRKDQRR